MIFVDMDGVVADFDLGIELLYGKRMDQMTNKEKDKFWDTDCVSHRFFVNLRSIPNGMRLVSRLIQENIEFAFLTSTGGEEMYLDIAKQKLEWLWDHSIGSRPVAFCHGTESKATFASSNHLLIDDRQKVIDAFQRRGGKAVLFQPDTWEESLAASINHSRNSHES